MLHCSKPISVVIGWFYLMSFISFLSIIFPRGPFKYLYYKTELLSSPGLGQWDILSSFYQNLTEKSRTFCWIWAVIINLQIAILFSLFCWTRGKGHHVTQICIKNFMHRFIPYWNFSKLFSFVHKTFHQIWSSFGVKMFLK